MLSLIHIFAYSIFQSISAFCNAGIDILGDQSYKGYATSPIVNFTTMALIVLSLSLIHISFSESLA